MARELFVAFANRRSTLAAGRLTVVAALLALVVACQAAPQPAPPPAPAAKPVAPAAAPQPVEKPAAPAAAQKPAAPAPAQKPAAPAPVQKPAAPAKELKKILVNTSGLSLLYTSLYHAVFTGQFEQEGLAAELIELAGAPQGVQAVLSGNTFMGLAPLNAHIAVVEKNQPVVGIAAAINQNANMLIVSKDWAEKNKLTPQTPLADRIKALKGARIGIVGPRSAVDDLARYLLVVYGGLNPDRDVQLIPLGASPNFPPALEKKQVDAFVGASPAAELAILRYGAFQAANLNTGEVPDLRGQLFIIYLVRRDSVEKRRDDVVGAVRAVARSQKAIAEKPDDAKRLLRERKFANIDADVFDLAWKHNLPGFAKTPVIEETGYKSNFMQLAKARGEVIPEIPFATAIDTSIAEQVAKELGLSR